MKKSSLSGLIAAILPLPVSAHCDQQHKQGTIFYIRRRASAYQYNKIRKKVNRAANFPEKWLLNI